MFSEMEVSRSHKDLTQQVCKMEWPGELSRGSLGRCWAVLLPSNNNSAPELPV